MTFVANLASGCQAAAPAAEPAQAAEARTSSPEPSPTATPPEITGAALVGLDMKRLSTACTPKCLGWSAQQNTLVCIDGGESLSAFDFDNEDYVAHDRRQVVLKPG